MEGQNSPALLFMGVQAGDLLLLKHDLTLGDVVFKNLLEHGLGGFSRTIGSHDGMDLPIYIKLDALYISLSSTETFKWESIRLSMATLLIS